MRGFVNRLLGRQRTCAVPGVSARSAHRRGLLRLSWPLVSFVVPTLVLAYGVLIPHSCIAGLNALSLGFGTTVLGACITYFIGVRVALRS